MDLCGRLQDVPPGHGRGYVILSEYHAHSGDGPGDRPLRTFPCSDPGRRKEGRALFPQPGGGPVPSLHDGRGLGTGLVPGGVFGLFERLSAFSAVVFNAFLGFFL